MRLWSIPEWPNCTSPPSAAHLNAKKKKIQLSLSLSFTLSLSYFISLFSQVNSLGFSRLSFVCQCLSFFSLLHFRLGLTFAAISADCVDGVAVHTRSKARPDLLHGLALQRRADEKRKEREKKEKKRKRREKLRRTAREQKKRKQE